jgi:hypothetical protein
MPGYPLWLAFNHFLGLPLLFTQHLLYMGAGLILLIPLRKVVSSPAILIVLYTIYLFNPAIETRVMRAGIYPALSILVFATLIGFYVYREEFLKFSLWSICLGFTMSMLWLTREEGIWIIPSVVLIMGYTLFQLYQTFKLSPNFLKRIIFFVFPFALLLTSIHTISAINEAYYGVYTLVEINAKPFTSAYGALLRVKHPHWKRYLPVPEVVRKEIYAVSPAFKEIESFLEGNIGKRWVPVTCGFYPATCPDIGGGWFMWALRESVAYAGYYQSALKANEYYQRLAIEVNTACEKKQLDCLPPQATLMPPYHPDYIPAAIDTFWAGVNRIIDLPLPEYVHTELTHSLATDYGLDVFHKVTGNPVSPIRTTDQYPDPTLTPLDKIKLNILQRFEAVYHALLSLSYFIIPVYIFCMMLSLFYRQFSFLFILNIAMLGAVVSRLIILTVIDISLFPTLFNWWAYLVPFYPLLLIFLVLATTDALQRCVVKYH